MTDQSKAAALLVELGDLVKWLQKKAMQQPNGGLMGAEDYYKAASTVKSCIAILSLPSSRDVPEGYMLVPLKPTPEMQIAGFKAWKDTCFRSDVSQGDDIYRAMLSALKSTPPAGVKQI